MATSWARAAARPLDLRIYLDDLLREFVASGKPVLGICNGFQTLVKAGLLPGWNNAERS